MPLLNKKLLAFLSIIFCNIGLLYQTYILVRDYFEGHTVVNIKIGRVYNETLPAISICYQQLLSFEKVARLNDEWQRIFDEYMIFVNKSNRVNHTQSRKEPQFYYDYYRNITKDVMANSTLTELDILTNFSIHSQNILILIIGNLYTNNYKELGLLHNYTQFKNLYLHNGFYAIESVIINILHPLRCFTLFSWLKHGWKDLETYLEKMVVMIFHDDKLFPMSEDYKMYMVMHSGQRMFNEMLDEFIELNPDRFYKLSYSRNRERSSR